MKVNDLKAHHKCKTRRSLSDATGYSTVTLWKWEKYGIPPRTQAAIEVSTNGELKADRDALNTAHSQSVSV